MNRLATLMKPTLLLLLLLPAAWAQQRVAPVGDQGPVAKPTELPNGAAATAPSSDYILGPRDQISVIVPDLADQFTTDETFRIDMSGDVTLPFAGRIHAAGLTTQGLEQEIAKNLARILKQPEVVVGIVAYASQPISILGEVNSPGVHQIAGGKSLLEAISSAGGFTEDVGNTVTITRSLKWGQIPLTDAHDDPTGEFSVASISVKAILHATNPAENIPVMPNDIISVSKAEVVYAVGSVNKPGGFVLGENETLSALQVLSLAEGLSKTAAPQRAMILRLASDSKTRKEITVNVKMLLDGSGTDMPLEPGDILFIPSSKAKTISYRALEAIVQTASGVAVYGRYGM